MITDFQTIWALCCDFFAGNEHLLSKAVEEDTDK